MEVTGRQAGGEYDLTAFGQQRRKIMFGIFTVAAVDVFASGCDSVKPVSAAEVSFASLESSEGNTEAKLKELASSGARHTLDNNPDTALKFTLSANKAKLFVPKKYSGELPAAEFLQNEITKGVRMASEYLQELCLGQQQEDTPDNEKIIDIPNFNIAVVSDMVAWVDSMYPNADQSQKTKEIEKRRMNPAFSTSDLVTINLDNRMPPPENALTTSGVVSGPNFYQLSASKAAPDFFLPVSGSFGIHAAHEVLHMRDVFQEKPKHSVIYELGTVGFLNYLIEKSPELYRAGKSDAVIGKYIDWLFELRGKYIKIVEKLKSEESKPINLAKN